MLKIGKISVSLAFRLGIFSWPIYQPIRNPLYYCSFTQLIRELLRFIRFIICMDVYCYSIAIGIFCSCSVALNIYGCCSIVRNYLFCAPILMTGCGSFYDGYLGVSTRIVLRSPNCQLSPMVLHIFSYRNSKKQNLLFRPGKPCRRKHSQEIALEHIAISFIRIYNISYVLCHIRRAIYER